MQINEEMEYYTDESSSLNNEGSGASELDYEDDEEFCKYHKEQIFQEIDFTKRKTKIACTIG